MPEISDHLSYSTKLHAFCWKNYGEKHPSIASSRGSLLEDLSLAGKHQYTFLIMLGQCPDRSLPAE